jgi:hypothetical protein
MKQDVVAEIVAWWSDIIISYERFITDLEITLVSIKRIMYFQFYMVYGMAELVPKGDENNLVYIWSIIYVSFSLKGEPE